MPKQTSTPRLRTVIRVFVSSTFSDMKAERNALQAQVISGMKARGIMLLNADKYFAFVSEKSGL